MLSVAVHKDVGEYQPKVIGKMTARTLVSIAGALGCSLLAGLYIYFVLGLNPGDNMFIIYAVSLPFWCCGFIRPHGMPFEQFAPLWLRANFENDHIFYKPSMCLSSRSVSLLSHVRLPSITTRLIAIVCSFLDGGSLVHSRHTCHPTTRPSRRRYTCR